MTITWQDFEGAVNCAGTPEAANDYRAIYKSAVDAATRSLVGPRRLFLMGNVTALRLPGKTHTVSEVPGGLPATLEAVICTICT